MHQLGLFTAEEIAGFSDGIRQILERDGVGAGPRESDQQLV